MDQIKEDKRLRDIVGKATKECIDEVFSESLNPTGLAGLFLEQAMELLDSNIQFCLRNDNLKGALSYLKVFMTDYKKMGAEIEAHINRVDLEAQEKF